MLKRDLESYRELRDYLDKIPIIDTHEHRTGIIRPVNDILDFYFMEEYFPADFESAAFDMPRGFMGSLVNGSAHASFEERFGIFRKVYSRTNKTAYARGLQTGLSKCWNAGEFGTLETIRDLERKFRTRDQAFYETTMEQNHIRAAIVDITDLAQFMSFVDGVSDEYSGYCRFALRLSAFHNLHCKNDILQLNIERYLGRTITCLDDYLEAFEAFLQKCLSFGIVCFKDHSAYRRSIAFENPTKADAEKAFNAIISNPRDVFGDDRVRVLDDWLFHYFLRQAAKHHLPVQIHTGTVSRVRNNIANTNAVHLIPVLELHQDVQFDLFHGNWPYMDEYLFIGKNYPNVTLNLCWLHCIDPAYSVELMKRAVMTVPHSKLFAFGGDCRNIELIIGYLTMAKDNAACALSDLVESGWLNMDEAKEILAAWFYNNPNDFYRLGFDPFDSRNTKLSD